YYCDWLIHRVPALLRAFPSHSDDSWAHTTPNFCPLQSLCHISAELALTPHRIAANRRTARQPQATGIRYLFYCIGVYGMTIHKSKSSADSDCTEFQQRC